MYSITSNSKPVKRKQRKIDPVTTQQQMNVLLSDLSFYQQLNVNSNKAAYAAKKESQNG